MMDEMNRLRELTQQLNAAAHAYYTLDNPVMADVQYDKLYDELLALEKKLNFRLPDSPTHRVGGEVLQGFSEHTHITRLWSMDKVQSETEMFSWLERMEKLEKPVDERAIHFSFGARRRTGEDVLQITELSKGFDGRTLFSDFRLHVRAGDRVAVIGPNGVGKSTLLKLIIGHETPDTGSIRIGTNVDIGYYDQHQSELHDD